MLNDGSPMKPSERAWADSLGITGGAAALANVVARDANDFATWEEQAGLEDGVVDFWYAFHAGLCRALVGRRLGARVFDAACFTARG